MVAKKKSGKDSTTVITKNKSSQGGGSSFAEVVKWCVVVALIGGGVYANAYFEAVAWALRAACGIVIVCAALAVALFTVQGQRAWVFAKSAKAELRKVVWPTRNEVVQSTVMVVVVVVATAVVLWGIDTLFLNGVGWLVGQRG